MSKKLFIFISITLLLCGASLFLMWVSRLPTSRIVAPDFFAIKAIMELPTVKSIPAYTTLDRAFDAVVTSRCQAALNDFAFVKRQLESAGVAYLILPYEVWCKELVRLGIASDSVRGQGRILINKLDFLVWPLYGATLFSVGYLIYLSVKVRRDVFY